MLLKRTKKQVGNVTTTKDLRIATKVVWKKAVLVVWMPKKQIETINFEIIYLLTIFMSSPPVDFYSKTSGLPPSLIITGNIDSDTLQRPDMFFVFLGAGFH